MFRNIAGLLAPVCIFCSLPEPRFACANALAFAVRDTSPVTPLHSLNLPRRHVSSYFDVDGKERDAMHQLLDQVRRGILRKTSPSRVPTSESMSARRRPRPFFTVTST
jgi:diadenosine tetraphosphate (Ap4A) HIT family hydrolase